MHDMATHVMYAWGCLTELYIYKLICISDYLFTGHLYPVFSCCMSPCHQLTFIYTSSTAQGGGGSFKNRKPIGEVGCCESGMAERIHWWTERCLRSPLFRPLSLTIYLPTYLSSMYLSIYRSIYLSLSLSFICLPVYLSSCLAVYLSICLSIYPSIYLSVYPSIHLSIHLSIYRSIYISLSLCLSLSLSLSSVYLSGCLPVYLSVYLSFYVYLSTCLSVVQCHSA